MLYKYKFKATGGFGFYHIFEIIEPFFCILVQN